MSFAPSTPEQRERAAASTRARLLGQKKANRDARTCLWCGDSLAGLKPNAKVCRRPRHCGTYHWRRERRLKAILARPRCCMCLGPMPYKTKWQGPGVGYSKTTCSPECRYRRQLLRMSMMRP